MTAAVASAPTATPVASWLTAGEAKAAAAQVAPGHIVDVDNRPTGLRYDVTLRHQDGTYTVVEVDAPTGRVVHTALADHRIEPRPTRTQPEAGIQERPPVRSTAMVSIKIAAAAAVAAAGIGLGAYSLGSAAGADVPQASPAAHETTSTPPAPGAAVAPAPASATSAARPTTSAALTLDQAEAVAARAASAPGRVVTWDEDSEPTGLRYDVTLLHANGSTTDVEVDAVTGRVTDIQHDDNRD